MMWWLLSYKEEITGEEKLALSHALFCDFIVKTAVTVLLEWSITSSSILSDYYECT